ncbi:c-di-AMP phosphodiesterase, consists of a GGDEF-like and DHH domains [Jeotgalicoccus aerolatus]|uniref:Cyclic-di-AMP phosphodiesterase n=1 Tax=Jeotgalicoccus aerolatus TaxID=709510 RepID=A0A1G9AB94_9STAP|nr:DHH family phosphoesterase [Jeotgalicoccus aerolatus]SDK23740.1 c-di-AMP phosphodiesterase, consists of a GGDEF-like and DHH domains [Jeotgalicoccus aerolatus]HJG33540.1 DHH family phosphoesterase [Jeotgalicoccus aerolatus]
MFKVLDKRLMLIPFIVLAFHISILSIAIVINYTVFGVISIIVSIVILVLVYIYLYRWLDLTEHRLVELSKDMSGARQYTIDHLPLGVILLNDDEEITWLNDFMTEQISEEFHHEPINRVFPNIMTTLKANNIQSIDSSYGEKNYQIHYYEENNALILLDITDEKTMQKQLEDKDPVIGILFLDNYDDMTQNMTEALKSDLNNSLTNTINDWALEHNIYLRRFSNDRFMMVMSAKSLAEIEKTKFVLLDQIRENSAEHGAQITISMGIGEGSMNFIEVGELAQSSLDLALGRGGDQVAIKTINGSARFYGGKTDPMEKRTRVKARVMAHALRDILLEGDNVIIMGHKSPDVDSIGSSIGVAKIASSNGIEAHIVLNDEDIDDTLSRLMKEVESREELYETFISSEAAWDKLTPKTTVVIVDTHRPSMVLDEDILNKATRKVVIDHHRRADEMISNPLLVYMEPYASSASELVAELLEYQNRQNKLSRIEATIMLTGIIVDTRNYTLRTGSRTFDAASYLRSNGADPVLAQTFLKDDIDTFIARSDLIKSAEIRDSGIAIVKADETMTYHPVTVAQAADQLLQIEGVQASFVMALREDETIGISARSLGKVNVQIIMEELNGGGHLTNAATRMEGKSIEEAYEELTAAIDTFIYNRSEEE